MSEDRRRTTGKLRVWPLAGLAVLSTVILVVGQGVLGPSGQFAADTTMSAARQGAAAATLADGRILITGGLDSTGNPLASAEFLGSSSTAGTMTTPRTGHIAVTLQDGRVLVGGGRISGGAVTNTAEVYDPSSGSWTAISAMLVARAGATATLLPDGRVLVTGGDGSGSPLQTTEIFDPASGQFNNGAPLTTVRKNHAAALLADGRVVIAGGSDGSQALASMDIYDPTTGQVSGFGSMATARAGLSATTLLDGKVLLAGGGSASTEILDPTTGAVTTGPAMSVARTGHVAQLLPNNNTVLMVGGTTASAAAEIFVEWQNQFQSFGNLSSARTGVAGGASMQSATARMAGGAEAGGAVSNAVDKVRFPMVVTDKADYSPGTTVNMTGSGFQPGETVTLILTEVPNLDTHTIAPVVADAVGNISSSEFVPDQHDLGIRFYLTATGASGLTAEATFTDNTHIQNVTVAAQIPNPVIAGNSATYQVTVRFQGTGTCTAALSVTTTLPTGATASFSPTSVIGGTGNTTVNSTLTIATANTTAGGTSAFTIQALGTAGDCVSDTQTVSTNLVVTASATTSTTIASSSNPSVYGQPVTFTATVSPATVPNGGTVTFKDGGTTLGTGTLSASHQATFSTSTLLATTSPHGITAVYAGAPGFLSSTSASLSQVVNQKALTATGLTAVNKIYNATTSATLTGTASLQAAEAFGSGTGVDGKPYTGDAVSVTGTPTGTFASKNVANGITVNITGLSLSGAQAGNYTLTAPTSSANITVKALTTSGLTAANKIYDATTTATLSGTAALQAAEAPGAGTTSDGAPYTGDVLNITGTPAGTFASKDVANGITVNTTGLSLTGAQGGNYTLTAPTATANITAKALTTGGLTANNKIYDATTAATLSGTAALQAAEAPGAGNTSDAKPYTGDTVSVTGTPTGTFATKDVSNGITVNITGLSLTGAQAANYTLTAPTSSANITAKALTASGLTAANKIYEATTVATLSGTAVLQAAEAAGAGNTSDGKPYTGDTVGVTGTPTGTFASKDVANGITVNTTGLSLTGTQSGNYTLTAPTATANITAKTLTASGLTANNKTYDATTAATLSGTVALQSSEAPGAGTAADAKPYTGDVVTVAGTPTGTFVSKNVANGITVNIGGLSLSGAQAGDYTLTAPASSANITALAITGSITASNKVYDGTATAAILTRTLSGALGSDVVSYTGGTAAFADKNVGTGKTVTGTGLSLTGADAGNYSVNATAATSADITARTLTITAASNTKTYDGATSAAAVPTVAGLQTGDTVTGLVETYDNKNAGSGKTLSVISGYTVNDGNSGGNYAVTLVANTAGVISAKAASVTPAASGKTYGDIDPPLTGTLSGFLAADNVVAGYARAPGEAAGTYSISAVLSPAGALGNYNITYNTAAFVISPKLASVTPNAASKIFGDADPSFTGTLTGFLPADNVTATYARTAGETVTGSPYTISATLSPLAVLGNYTITYNTADFTIQKYTIAGCPSAGCGVDSSNNPKPGAFVALDTNSIPFMGSITAQVTMRPYSVGGEPLLKQTTVNNVPVPPAFTVYLVPQDGGGNPMWAGAIQFGNGMAVQVATPSGTGTSITAQLPGSVVPGKYYAVVYGDGAAALGSPGVLDDAGYTGTDTSTFIYPTLISDTLTVVKADQTITFGALSGKNYGDPAFTVSATGGASGNAVIFSSTTAGTCSVSGSTVTILHAGSCTIEAAQAGNSNYNDATPVDRSFNISPVALTITADNKSKAYGAALPMLTVHYSGLVNNDTPTTFSAAPNASPTISTTATASSHVAGSPYSITASGAVDPDYIISYLAGTLTVNPVPLQITAANQTKIYGAALPALTVTYTGLTNGDTPATFSASPNTAPTITTTATAASHVAGSPYTITASGAVDSDYYPINYMAGALTVTPAALTITADNKTKAYGAALPALTASYAGFVNSDTSASLTTQPALSTTATAASHVAGSPYPITASGAVDTDYNISYVAGTLTITAVPLTITADNQSKAYGAALPALTASYAGFVNNDTSASLTTQPSLSTNATAASHVSGNPYSITASGAVDQDYTISYAPGTLTITAVPLTITANNQTKAYGAALPALTVTYTGLVNGDTAATFSTPPNVAPTVITTATVGSHVSGSPYAITVSAAVDSDYTINYVAGTLTVNPVPLNIRLQDQSKVYGAPLPTLTVVYYGLVNGDPGPTTLPTITTTATAASHVAGNTYPITANGAADSDYSPITYTPGALTVTPAALTITADNKTKLYGAALPALTASYLGFVNGDSSPSLTTQPSLSTTATAASHVASYPITASGATDADYSISYVAGTLSITAVPLTITADNKTKPYAAALPALTASYSGFVNGDTSASLTTPPSLSTAATAASHVAGNPYSITASGAVDADYTISYVAGALTITTVPLTITADDQTKAYGAALPTLTVSYAGLQNGDTPATFSAGTNSPPAISTTATAASHVAGGPYAITASGAVDPDYAISYAAGSLTVTPVPLNIRPNDQTKVYGAPLPALAVTYSGLANGDSATTTPPTVTTTATAASHVSGNPYQITANGAVDSDYSPITYTSGALTVTPAGLTITADNKTKVYGAPLPALTVSYTGFASGDTSASLTAQPLVNTASTAASHVGNYPITASGAVDPDYSISYVAGSLTVTPASLTITADNKTKVYGAALPPLTASYSGFVNGDTYASLTTQPTLSTTAVALSSVTVNGYPITASGAVDTDYTIGYVAGTLTVTKAPLTITATTNTKTYNGTTSAAATPTWSGLQGSDSVTGLAETYADKNVGSGKTLSVSAYTVNDGNSGGNYTVTLVPNMTGVINQAPLTVSATGINKLYDGTTAAAVTLSDNRVANDVFTASYASASFADVFVGSGKTVTVNGISLSGADASNYSFNASTTTTASISASPTQTVLSSSLTTPPNNPTNITLTAKVTSATTIPIGSVTFTDTSRTPVVVLGSANLSGGTATLASTSAALTGGSHLIVATYNPPPNTFVTSLSSGNTAPTVTITGPPSGDVDPVSTVVNFTATYSDSTVAGAGTTAQWSFASSDTTAAVAGLVNATTGAITGSNSFPTAGVYAVTLTVNDGLGGITIANIVNTTSVSGLPASVVVYDPAAGFVTGGGWINSPSGAYAPNPALTGKASFGFVSKYQKGATIPTGETQFTFQVANFDFHSTVYQWLVVSGPMAQYKGSGTINGAGNYNFLLTSRDGSLAGGNTPDGFRIKITDPVSGATIYDNLLSTDNTVTSANTQALGGGSIMIHSK